MCGYVRVCVRMCVCVNACVCVCVRGFNCHVMGAQKCGITAQEIRPYAFIKKSPSRSVHNLVDTVCSPSAQLG